MILFQNELLESFVPTDKQLKLTWIFIIHVISTIYFCGMCFGTEKNEHLIVSIMWLSD